MRRSSPDRSPITKLAATRVQDTDATVIGMARDGFDTSQTLDPHIPFAWNSEDKVFEVEIQCRWIRTGYTFLHRWSRLLAIGTILISLFANLSPRLPVSPSGWMLLHWDCSSCLSFVLCGTKDRCLARRRHRYRQKRRRSTVTRPLTRENNSS